MSSGKKRSVREIAERIAASVIGDGSVEIAGLASIPAAGAADLVFVEDEKNLAGALASKAAAVIAGNFAAGNSAPANPRASRC